MSPAKKLEKLDKFYNIEISEAYTYFYDLFWATEDIKTNASSIFRKKHNHIFLTPLYHLKKALKN